MRRSIFVRLALAMACLAFLGAGCRAAKAPVEGPHGSLAVAPFTQPLMDSELLAGFIPEEAVAVKPVVLGGLDAVLAEELGKGLAAQYQRPAEVRQCMQIQLSANDGKRRTALESWLEVGRCLGVDYLLVPQLMLWGERDGSEIAVRRPAAVILDLYLVDVKAEGLAARYHFDEAQLSLTENILDADKFVKRKGKWITATELAREGLARGVKEFGL
ncbi:hypothetical protein GGQ74_001025 [Desulfobaculum xiamenense]|uniref:Lipoprotein n=1 Tax=Desulfobaculum xiamenense TaxID=995050 RepID=A0A846QPP7_9BACT|nr:hypothetical protein [Desulfobaculum xiamenense]NJB67385.1 hypothetical protein [Desulfobaculum xiamenense]